MYLKNDKKIKSLPTSNRAKNNLTQGPHSCEKGTKEWKKVLQI